MAGILVTVWTGTSVGGVSAEVVDAAAEAASGVEGRGASASASLADAFPLFFFLPLDFFFFFVELDGSPSVTASGNASASSLVVSGDCSVTVCGGAGWGRAISVWLSTSDGGGGCDVDGSNSAAFAASGTVVFASSRGGSTSSSSIFFSIFFFLAFDFFFFDPDGCLSVTGSGDLVVSSFIASVDASIACSGVISIAFSISEDRNCDDVDGSIGCLLLRGTSLGRGGSWFWFSTGPKALAKRSVKYWISAAAISGVDGRGRESSDDIMY